MHDIDDEIAATAARLVVEEGLEYASAKRRALKTLGLPSRSALPSNDVLDTHVREYIEIFCGDTQPGELLALREHALVWMRRMADFRPHLSGAVWRGTATRLSDIYIALFCDDSKAAEITLIDKNVQYKTSTITGLHGDAVDALSISRLCKGLNEHVGVHLLVYGYDDLRGALKAPNSGASAGQSPRGDVAALERLLEQAQVNDPLISQRAHYQEKQPQYKEVVL
jgi:hypothetical protein